MRSRLIILSCLILGCAPRAALSEDMFHHLLTRAVPPFTWVGGAGTNWSTAANWSTGAVPGSSDTATFDNNCGSNCTVTLDAHITPGNIDIKSTFTGSIAQGGYTIATNSFSQAGGTFTGGSDIITVNSNFALSGGTFVAPAAQMQVVGNFTVSGSPTFTHNSGTLLFRAGNRNITPGSATYYNVKFDPNGASTVDLQAGTMNVAGTLTISSYAGCSLGCILNNGTLNLTGNLTTNSEGMTGTALVKIAGSGNQTLDGSTSTGVTGIPNLQIASTGGTVSLVGYIRVVNNYTYTSGTINAGTSTMDFLGDAQTIIPGSVTYNSARFKTQGGGTKTLSSGTLNLGGDLELNAYAGCGTGCMLSSGTIALQGNLTISGDGYRGNAVLQFTGAGDSTIAATATSRVPTGTISVNKSSRTAKVTLLGAFATATSQSLTVTQGVLDMAGFALTATSATLTIALNGTLRCNGGTHTQTTYAMDGIDECSGYGFFWTGGGGAGNTNWSNTANWSGSVVPGPSNVAQFSNAYCGSNCNATINGTPTVKGIRMMSDYTGTITQASGATLTVGIDQFRQESGTFTGTDAALTMSSGGGFELSGGTFTSTSAILTMISNFTITGGTFNHNDGTIKFTGSTLISTGSTVFKHVDFAGFASSMTVTGSVIVSGLLTLEDGSGSLGTINTGTIVAQGDVLSTARGYHGTGKIQIAGSGNQTLTSNYTGVATAVWPLLEIASTGGTVSLVGTFNLYRGYIWTSGTVDAGTSLLLFSGTGPITPQATPLYDVTIAGTSVTYTITGTLTVNGTLAMAGASATSTVGGIIEAKGDVTATNIGAPGTTSLRISGSTNQTVSSVSGGLFPNIEIASTGGIVTFTGTPSFQRNFIYTSGVVDASAATIQFTSSVAKAITAGPIAFNNVTFGGTNATITLSDTMTVNGTLTLADTYSAGSGALVGGTILATGPVVSSTYGYGGTTVIKIAGSTNQTVSGISTSRYPVLEIASTGGTVTFSGILNVARDYTYTSGTMDYGTSTLAFITSAARTIKMGATPYNNVTFGGSNTQYTLSDTLSVNGALSLADTYGAGSPVINGTTIEAYGPVSSSLYGAAGSVTLKIMGSTSQTITGASTAPFPLIEIASTGGTVSYSGTIRLAKGFTYTSGTIDPGTSLVTTLTASGVTATLTVSSSSPFYDFTFSGAAPIYVISGTLLVNRDLTFGSTYDTGQSINGGTIEVLRNVSSTSYGFTGSTLIKVKGSTDQTITGASTQSYPSLEIASTGGTVTLSGTLSLRKNYTYTSGTISQGSAIVHFYNTTSGVDNTITPGAITYGDVTISGSSIGNFALTGTLTVGGTLTMGGGWDANRTITGGTIVARGNVVLNNYGYKGTVALTFGGSSNTTLNIAAAASRPAGAITISKTGGAALTLQTAALFNTAGQTMSITSGSVSMAGFAMTVASTLTLSAGTSITRSGGVLTANGATVNAGAYSGGTIF